MSYIETTDVTDTQAKAFITANDGRVTTWMARANAEVESVAQEKDVQIASISTPVHAKIKEYALAYLCFIIFQDVFGTNNNEVSELEKYKVKMEWYENRCQKLKPSLTYEMFTYTSTAIRGLNRAGGHGLLWRG